MGRLNRKSRRSSLTKDLNKDLVTGELGKKAALADGVHLLQQQIDVAALQDGIQQLCQAANPLGKSIDLVHQDVDQMAKELDHWRQEHRS